MAQLLFPTAVNALQKQLNANYTASDAVITLNNTTNIQNKPGVCVINRVDTNGTRQPSANWTYIEYTGTSGSTLTGCTAISGDQDQALGKVVEFVSDVTAQQRILDAMANLVVVGTGALDTTKVVDLSSSQTLTTKTLTSPVINTGFSGTAKAAGSDVTTGTSDTTIVTPKALADATVGKLGAAWTAFTPEWTNLTVGSGTNTGAYCQIGKTVHLRTSLVFAANTSISGSVNFTLPVAIHAGYATGQYLGFVRMTSAGTNYVGVVSISGGITVLNASGTYLVNTVLSSTVPGTWTTNDAIHVSMTYEAA